MSEKRKLNSSSDSEESNEDIPSLKRKPEELSIDDEERNELKRLEDKYDKRYTEEDPEYKACLDRPDPSPPILINYYGKNKNRGNFRRDDRSGWRGRGGHRADNYRDNYRDNRRDHWRNNREDNRNQNPYNRY